MAFSHDQRNPMAIRFPEEKGMECLVDIQLNMLKYFVNRNFDTNSELSFYSTSFNSMNHFGVVQTFSNFKKIHKMMVYGEKSASHCMTFMKHDKKIAVGTSKGTLVMINLNDYLDGMREQKSMRTIKKIHELSINAMRLNRRGDWLLTGDKSGLVKFFQTEILYENQEKPSEILDDPRRHQEAIRDIAFSPSSRKFGTCSDDKTIKIGDIATGKIEKNLLGHGSDVSTLDWHPHLSMIASGGKDRILKIWDPRMEKELCSLYNHTNSICKVRYSTCGEYLLTGGRDQTARLFDVRKMDKELVIYTYHQSDILSLDWNPARQDIFSCADGTGVVTVFSVNFDRPLCVMEHANNCEVWDLAWNNMGNFLATCGGNRLINLFTSKFWIPNLSNLDVD